MGCVSSNVAQDDLRLERAPPRQAGGESTHLAGGLATQVRTSPNEPSSARHVPEETASKRFQDVYVLKRRLGKGSFASVHLAEKISDGSAVAAKITNLCGKRKEAKGEICGRILDGVAKEVQMLRMVSGCEHCLCFLEAFTDGTSAYIVTERCDLTLLQAMESLPRLTESALKPFFQGMLRGLDCIHKLGVIHRDVKPDNYMCAGARRTVKLCDFGFAREALPGGVAEVKGVFGTPPFMSPEMLDGSGYGTGTDIWSLGVIAYALLFGCFPYMPAAMATQAMKAAIVGGSPAPAFKPSASLGFDPDYLSQDATGFVEAALNRSKARRPSAADALAMPWLSEEGERGRDMPSLQPMLDSAKRWGAFDNNSDAPSGGRGVDQLRSAANVNSQIDEKRRSSRSQRASGRPCPDSPATLTSLGRTPELGQISLHSSQESTATGTSASSRSIPTGPLGTAVGCKHIQHL